MKRVKLFLMLMLLTVMSVESWSAVVYVDVDTYKCSSTLTSGTYTVGSVIEFTVTPNSGYYCYSCVSYVGTNPTQISTNRYSYTVPNVADYVVITCAEVEEEIIDYHVPSCVTSPSGMVETSTYATATPAIEGYTFEGWTKNGSYTNSTTKPTGLDARTPGSSVVTSEEVYAVYSYYTGTPASETFDVCGGAISAGYYVFSTNKSGASCNAISGTEDGRSHMSPTSITGSNTTATMSPSQRDAVWQVEASSTYWTFKNMDNGKYLAATSTNNQLVLVNSVDDYAKWNVAVVNAENKTYRIWNKQNSSSAIKYFTSSGSNVFASSSTGTSGNESILYLFKKTTAPGFGQTTNYTINPTCPGLSVTYVGGAGATGSVTDGNTYEFEDEVTIKSNTSPGFTKAGYNFVGWTCDYRLETVDGDPYEYLIGETIPAGEVITMPAADITLTAVWEAKTYLYGSSCEPLENITVTYNDAGTETEVEYGAGTIVPVDSRTGTSGCSGWTFAGWSASSVAANSTSYTPVHNFTAATDITLYAVYDSVGTDWMSALNISELKSGATYVITKITSGDNNDYALTTTVASTNYLEGSLLTTDCETVKDAGNNNRYKLKVTPTAAMKWEAGYTGGYWRLYNKASGKYLKLTSDGYALTADAYDEFTASNGYNDSELNLQSRASTKYLMWRDAVWKGWGSAGIVFMHTNAKKFTSTPPCSPRSVTFYGNGGTVSDGVNSGPNLVVTEASRDAGITTPTATFADCNGKSWSFVGWSEDEIDVTRVPVLTTDLLNGGGGNKHHDITKDGEKYYAVYTNEGIPETKRGLIVFDHTDFPASYPASAQTTTVTVGGNDYDFEYARLNNASGYGIQFEEGQGVLQNTTSLGRINYVTFIGMFDGDDKLSRLKLYVGNSPDACNVELTASMFQSTGDSLTFYPSANYPYLKIYSPSQYAAAEKIKIGFGMGTKVWATTPDCSTITLTGTPRITSYAGKTVKGVTALTVNAQQLKASTPLTFKAYNVADDTENTHFGFVGSVSALADGTVTNQTIIVTYTPAGDATTDGIEEVYFKATALADDNVTTTESNQQTGYGRHLPTKFVIATKVGDKWYGMPNNIATTSYGTRALIPIVVNDATSPTTATVYTSTTDYLAWNMNCAGTGTARYASDGEKIAFTSPINANKALMGSSTGIKNSAALPSPITLEYLWKPETSDLGNYTLLNGDASTYYIATDGSDNWKTYTTGANVRFLSIVEQPAPDITWYNDMLDADHATNKAENGVVTLPTGADPVSCNATLLPTFCGWKDGAISTYVTSAPTYVQAGDAATTDKKYYAVFKHATLDRWYTDCPTIYTITYTANGGTGSDHLEYTMNTTADAITVGAAGFSKEGCTFIGWTNPDDVDGTIITPGAGKITGLSGDITLNAVWIGTTTITGTVRLTTAAGEKVATSGTEVTISSTDFACATALRITYKDVTNDVTYGRSGTPSYTSSEFRLCNGSYGYADLSNISLAEVSGAYNQTFSITYEPKGGANTLDHYQLKIEVLLKNTVIETKTLDLYGRTLPAVFAIATKIGGAWYALPNDMSASGTYDPILISVTEDANVLNWTAQGPANTAYIMRDYTVNYSKLRFAVNAVADENKYCLWAADGNAAGIRNYSAISTDAAYGWIVTETNADFSGYTMATSNNSRTGLMISNNKWGMANSGNSEIHFIPLTTVETIDIIAREWKTNGLVFAIDADNNISTTSGHTQYGIDAAPSTNVTSITRHSTGGYGLYEVGLADITGDYGKVLSLKMKVGGVDKIANVTIPIIVSGTGVTTAASEPFTTLGTASKDYDVVILDGAKLTTNATALHASSFHNFYVYSGGTWINDNGSTSLNYLELRGGIKGIGAKDSHEQGVPHVLLNKAVSSTNGANLDMTVYTDHGYALSVPFDVALSTVNFANSLKPGTGAQVNGTLASQFWIRKYDGEVRANNGRGGWVDITPADNKTIHAGEGYTLQGKRPKGQPFAVIRFPFSGVASWANASGEVEKADIPIYAYEGGANTPDNDKGWNLIANPYMATIAYNTEDELSWAASFKVGNLEKTDGANWDGKYQWTDASHAYVTIPNDSYTAFPQTRASKATFYPFKNFFIQASSNGVVAFVRTDRSEIQQRLMAQEEQMAPIFADINLAHGSESAQAGLTIDAGATAGYKFGEDYTIFESREELDYLKVYTIADGHYLVGNTLTPAETTEMIPLEFYAPNTTGEYVFSLDEGSDIDRLEYVILYDAELGLNTNLLTGSYAVELDKTGLIENRFSIGLKIKEEEQVTTGTGDVDDEAERPFKFIHNDKMYILRNGKLYDATGKMVREINK